MCFVPDASLVSDSLYILCERKLHITYFYKIAERYFLCYDMLKIRIKHFTPQIKIFNREICVCALLATNSFNATSQHS